MKLKKQYWFEIGMPAHQYWVFRVRASSMEEALEKIENSHDDAGEVYQLSCAPGTTRPKLLGKTPVEEGAQ